MVKLVGIDEAVLFVELAKRTISLLLFNQIVDHLKEVFLSLLHQHTNLSMGEGTI